MTAQKRVLIALYNMGGPSSSTEVAPFLSELFNDPDLLDIPMGHWLQNFVAKKIINKRLDEVIERYALMGGGSPQLPITRNVAEKLEDELRKKNDQPLFAAPTAAANEAPYTLLGITPLFRYSEPRARSVLQQCIESGADELWLVSQYPHCARATTGTSLREIGQEQSANPAFAKITVRSLTNYFDEPAFVDLWTERVGRHWHSIHTEKKHLIISAHNLPLSYVAQGDPYPAQIRKTAFDVMRRLGLHEGIHWTLCCQSAVGPVKWMQPTTDDTIKSLCSNGVDTLIVWPIAFVSDHIETLVEIDAEYADMAKSLGCNRFERIANLNADNDFIQLLSSYICKAAHDLTTTPESPLLRELQHQPAGPYCSLQAGGCLCGNYYLSGRDQKKRGTSFARIDASSNTKFNNKTLGAP